MAAIMVYFDLGCVEWRSTNTAGTSVFTKRNWDMGMVASFPGPAQLFVA